MGAVRRTPSSTRRQHGLATIVLLLLLVTASEQFTQSPRIKSSNHHRLYSSSSQRQQQKKEKRTGRFAQSVHHKGKKNGRKPAFVDDKSSDALWRRPSRSIDDLEASLTKRWGTDLSQWTAQEKDLEEEDETEFVSKSDAPRFRAKPVGDPWEPKKKNGETNSQSSPVARSTIFGGIPSSQEFYDPDDVGYEPATRSSSSVRMDLSHLISPKPVGGSGKLTEERQEVEEEGKRRQQQRNYVPLRDSETDEPLILTTEQAERMYPPPDNLLHLESSEEQDASTWESLGITTPLLLNNLEQMGCPEPLPVQVQALQALQENQGDVVIGTYTGSGKTLCFLVPILQKLLQEEDDGNKQIQALVVAPGRELASQIVSVAKELLDGSELSAMLAIGGTTFERNLQQIRKRRPQLVLGTPGRLTELILGAGGGTGSGRLAKQAKQLQYLVLDECDALLNGNTAEPTGALLRTLQRQRQQGTLQTIMCSATASLLLKHKGKDELLRPGYRVVGLEQEEASITLSPTLIHGVVHVPHRRLVLQALRNILHTQPAPQQVLVFCENARAVDRTVEQLARQYNIVAAPLKGSGTGETATSEYRAHVCRALRQGRVGLVVTTELAARGLDAPLLTHVINLNLPSSAAAYAHRAGRCGRAGRPGVVLSLTTQAKERHVPAKLVRELNGELFTVQVQHGKLNIIKEEQEAEN